MIDFRILVWIALTRLDLIISSLVLILSLIGAFISLSDIREIQNKSRFVRTSLFFGEQRFVIVSKENCIGEGTLKFEKADGQMVLLISAVLRTKQKNAKTMLKVHGDFTFNLVGQLGAAIIRFNFTQSEDSSELAPQKHEIVVGLEEINPIRVSLFAPFLGIDKLSEIRIPGPIEIYPVGRDEYQIRYTPLVHQEAIFQSIFGPAFDSIALELKSDHQSILRCQEMEGFFLNLDPLIEKFKIQVQGLTRLFSAVLPPALSSSSVRPGQ